MHNLGSRNWHDANWEADVVLGEDVECGHEWDDGEPPAIVPLPRIAGSAACLRDGEPIEEAIDFAELQDGVPLTCFLPESETDRHWAMASSYERCGVQHFYARVIQWLYDDDAQSIADAVFAFLGPSAVCTVHPAEGLMPSVCTIIEPGFAVCIFDGTRDFQQLALQAFEAIRRPTNMGAFGTEPLWWRASEHAHEQLLADGWSGNTPIMISGHSYGAAAALVLAARYRFADRTRVIRYITFGCPKPGDQRLHDLVATCPGINLANDDDLVTVLPPDRITLDPVMLFLGLPILEVFVDWVRPPNQTRQDRNGDLTPNGFPLLDYTTLLALVEKVLIEQIIEPLSGHNTTEYLERIMRRCPDPEWPVDLVVKTILKKPWPEDEGLLLGGGVPATGDLLLGGDAVAFGDLLLGGGVGPAAAGDLLLGDGGVPAAGDLLLGDGGVPAAGDLLLGGGVGPAAGDLLLGDGGVPAAGDLLLGGGVVPAAGDLLLGGDAVAEGDLLLGGGVGPDPGELLLGFDLEAGELLLGGDAEAIGELLLGGGIGPAAGELLLGGDAVAPGELLLGGGVGPAAGELLLGDGGGPAAGELLLDGEESSDGEFIAEDPGDGEWEVPEGVYVIRIFAQGGGGGGEDIPDLDGRTGGGGGGGACVSAIVAVTPGDFVPYHVGDAGAYNTPGFDGESSWVFDSAVMEAGGGTGGGTTGQGDGGAGGVPTGISGVVMHYGGDGGGGEPCEGNMGGGCGGGSAGSSADGGAGDGASLYSVGLGGVAGTGDPAGGDGAYWDQVAGTGGGGLGADADGAYAADPVRNAMPGRIVIRW